MTTKSNAADTLGNKPKVSKKQKALAAVPQHIQSQSMVVRSETEALIERAIDKNVPVETMEKLLAMRRELKAEKAKEEYDVAMAKFQAVCPVITKDKKVYEKGSSTKVRYEYAPLDSIVSQVKPFLSEHGFSYKMKVTQDDKMLGVICVSTHSAGHSEETTFSVPIGSESYMSDVQKYGARLTFAKRYAFCNAFGILTGDGDTDATAETIQNTNTPPPAKSTPKPTVAPAAPQVQPQQPVGKPVPAAAPKQRTMASHWQINRIGELMKQKSQDIQIVFDFFHVKMLEELTSLQASATITRLIKMPDMKNEESVDVEEVAAGIDEMKGKPQNTPEVPPWDKKPESSTQKEPNPPATPMQIAWITTHFVDLVNLGLMGKDDQPKISFCSQKEYKKYFDTYTSSFNIENHK